MGERKGFEARGVLGRPIVDGREDSMEVDLDVWRLCEVCMIGLPDWVE
jgi:hypothetical protein